MSKRIIRLTETDLRNMISKCVENALNEAEFNWNAYSNYDVHHDPYDDYYVEPDEFTIMGYEEKKARAIARDIDDGLYDEYMTPDKFDKFEDKLTSGFDINNGYGYDIIVDTLRNRYYTLNKDEANKYVNRQYKDREAMKPLQIQNMYGKRNNDYRGKDGLSKDAEINKAWDDKEKKDFAKHYPELMKKSGQFRSPKQFKKGIERLNHPFDVADKRPLHRKGSINRA